MEDQLVEDLVRGADRSPLTNRGCCSSHTRAQPGAGGESLRFHVQQQNQTPGVGQAAVKDSDNKTVSTDACVDDPRSPIHPNPSIFWSPCGLPLCSFTTACFPCWFRETTVDNRFKPLQNTAKKYPLLFL